MRRPTTFWSAISCSVRFSAAFLIRYEHAVVKDVLLSFELVAIGGVDFTLEAADHYRTLRRRSITVRKTIDLLIGTYCIVKDCALLHSDRDFDPIMAQHLGLRALSRRAGSGRGTGCRKRSGNRHSDPVIVAVPGHEAGQALLDLDLRVEAEIALRRLDVGVGLPHVARLHGREFLDRLAADRLLEHGDELHQRLAAMVADIVNGVRRGVAADGWSSAAATPATMSSI